MPHRIIVASLVRNEKDRFLRSALEEWDKFADEIIILDDSSSDDSAQMSLKAGARTYLRYDPNEEETMEPPRAWGEESYARKELWSLAYAHADEGDYIFILDADMVPANDPRPFVEYDADGIAFPLYDLWADDMYRSDNYWCAHNFPRVWMVKKPAAFEWKTDRGIHCGHFPSMSHPSGGSVIAVPMEYSLLHYGYLTPEIREEKYRRYLGVQEKLSHAERIHAETILDPRPSLFRIPFEHAFELRLEGGQEGGDISGGFGAAPWIPGAVDEDAKDN